MTVNEALKILGPIRAIRRSNGQFRLVGRGIVKARDIIEAAMQQERESVGIE